jgi:uncharacterized membrane protein
MNAPARLTAVIEGAEFLDPIFGRLRAAAHRVITPGPMNDALSGKPLGHPIHPALTDLPIGAWTSAMLLDVFGGKKMAGAAQRLVGFGVLTAVPTVMSGWTDGAKAEGRTGRIVTVHAASNLTAVVLYAKSWNARRHGRQFKGVMLGMLGGTVATFGGLLGGNLAFASGQWSNDGEDAVKTDGAAAWSPPDRPRAGQRA